MLAFRRLLACRAPVLRFYYSASERDIIRALTIEDQIEGINKSLGDVNVRISICESTILEKGNAIQKVVREINKAPFEDVPKKSGHSSETPNVNTMLKELEKLGDVLKVLSKDDCVLGTQDVTKILKGVEEWEDLKDGFEDYYTPMRDVEEDLKLVASVRIIKAHVNDVRKRLENDKE